MAPSTIPESTDILKLIVSPSQRYLSLSIIRSRAHTKPRSHALSQTSTESRMSTASFLSFQQFSQQYLVLVFPRKLLKTCAQNSRSLNYPSSARSARSSHTKTKLHRLSHSFRLSMLTIFVVVVYMRRGVCVLFT